MTGHRLNATAELRFPKRWGRYRPHRPYRPTPSIHKGLRADGMSVACAQTVHDAPNPAPGAPTFAHGPRGRQASTPWPTGTSCRPAGQRRASGAATGGLGVGTTLPGRCDRAAGAVAKIDTVCLRAKKNSGRIGGYPATAKNMREHPAWHSTRGIIASGSRCVKRRSRT